MEDKCFFLQKLHELKKIDFHFLFASASFECVRLYKVRYSKMVLQIQCKADTCDNVLITTYHCIKFTKGRKRACKRFIVDLVDH